jgi:hypothetical protein
MSLPFARTYSLNGGTRGAAVAVTRDPVSRRTRGPAGPDGAPDDDDDESDGDSSDASGNAQAGAGRPYRAPTGRWDAHTVTIAQMTGDGTVVMRCGGIGQQQQEQQQQEHQHQQQEQQQQETQQGADGAAQRRAAINRDIVDAVELMADYDTAAVRAEAHAAAQTEVRGVELVTGIAWPRHHDDPTNPMNYARAARGGDPSRRRAAAASATARRQRQRRVNNNLLAEWRAWLATPRTWKEVNSRIRCGDHPLPTKKDEARELARCVRLSNIIGGRNVVRWPPTRPFTSTVDDVVVRIVDNDG